MPFGLEWEGLASEIKLHLLKRLLAAEEGGLSSDIKTTLNQALVGQQGRSPKSERLLLLLPLLLLLLLLLLFLFVLLCIALILLLCTLEQLLRAAHRGGWGNRPGRGTLL